MASTAMARSDSMPARRTSPAHAICSGVAFGRTRTDLPVRITLHLPAYYAKCMIPTTVDGSDARPSIEVCQYVPVPKTPLPSKPLPLVACCAPLSAEPIPRPTARRLASSFRALADPARLRLLSLIQAQP